MTLEKARAAYAAKMRATAAQRFWAKVDRKGEDDCWEWQAHRQRIGYGIVRWNTKLMLAHRVAMSLTDGDWDNPLSVCHYCDNRACCNPSHLWRGSHADNIKDMDNKGRRTTPRGEINGNAKLTADDIAAIRTSDKSGAAIAKEYGLVKGTVSAIRNRKAWRHL